MALKARRNGINKRRYCAKVLCRSSLSCIRTTSELYMKKMMGLLNTIKQI